MLVPAVTRKDEIIKASQALFYTQDYFYYMGDSSCYPINIRENSEDGYYQWASVDANDKLVGYIAYNIDFYAMCAFNFGLISFDKGNLTLPQDLNIVMARLVSNPIVRRIEYRGVVPNPALKAYERFCKKYHGNEYTFHDAVRDPYGQWHDEKMFEILFSNKM